MPAHFNSTGLFSSTNHYRTLAKKSRFAVIALAVISAFFISTAAIAATPAFDIFSGGEKGETATGSAKGTVTASYDEITRKDVLDVSYSLPQGSTLAIWAKDFPAELNAESVGVVKAGVHTFNSSQVEQISVELQIKGAKEVQSASVTLKEGWNSVQVPVDWEKIGDLSEIVFVLSPKGDSELAKGGLYITADFLKPEAPKAVAPVVAAAAPVVEKSVASKTEIVQEATKPAPAKVITRASFGLLDAGDKGVSTEGEAKGSVTFSFDDEARKDVYDLSYSLTPGASVIVWAHKFPSELTALQLNTIDIGLRAFKPSQLSEIAIKAEIKGTSGSQTFPLTLKPGWTSIQKSIRWDTVGKLTQVNFIITPKKKDTSLKGSLFIGFDFCRVTFFQKYPVFIKFGMVLAIGFLLALVTFLMGKIFGKGNDEDQSGSAKGERILSAAAPVPASFFSKISKDLFYGVVVALIGGTALWIYSLSTLGSLNAAFIIQILAIGFLGVVIAALLKIKFTSKWLKASEVLQNFLLTGFLAAASTKMELLQAPTAWGQLGMISSFTAAIAFLLYHVFNANSLGASGKHLKPAAGAMIVGTPFLFGWLLLLENVTMLQNLTYSLTGGLLAAWPAGLEFFGRLFVVFVFNEVLVNGLGLVTKGQLLKTSKAHLFILVVSAGVVLAPYIANFASIPLIAGLPVVFRGVASVLLTMLSFAGLWGEIYLLTGTLLDSSKRMAASAESIWKHVTVGMKKGMAYSGILMALLYLLYMAVMSPVSQKVMSSFPYAIGILAGALLFPLVKTLIETFDGSLPFFDRVRFSYGNWTLYLRGAIVGFGFTSMIVNDMFTYDMGARVKFGCWIGFLASGGVSILRDVIYAMKKQGKIQSWRLYFTDSCLGAFLGSAVAFYLDVPQVSTVVYKFKLYMNSRFGSAEFNTHPYFNYLGHYVQPVLVSKWGQMDLGHCPGGVKLLFTESLDGVIKWSVATWLFAINKVFMQAFFDKDKTPIKFFFSKAGLAQLTELMIYVLRWGLWMSPIIYTFLRMMPTATWYNQDGAIRTAVATWQSFTMSAPAFQAWSLKIFVWILAFDWFRILIWMDHMGLRVATLVNLSFLGMDKLDEKVARFIGPATAQRYIPEGVKRFTTWAPLLIPFYLPRGKDWDYVWSTAEGIQNANRGKGLIPWLQSLSASQMVLLIVAAVFVCAVISAIVRALHRRAEKKRIQGHELGNREYRVTLKGNGEVFSEVIAKESDVSRRSYDLIDPSGRILYLVDTAESPESGARSWPVVGNFPEEYFELSQTVGGEDFLKVINGNNGVKTTVRITLPDADSTAEIWNVTVENLSDKQRQLKVVPYLEWVLNGWMHDRFHTQYQRLYPEMEYVSGANAILAANKSTKSMGFIASDISPEGFLRGRVDFIGRARSIWDPRALETLDFLEAKDTPACPTFDPIGSMMIGLTVGPRATKTVRLMIGFSKKKDQAVELIKKYLKPQQSKETGYFQAKKHSLLIGHGEIPEGTPQPYYEYRDNGNKLLIKTPYTPRPFDHGMANTVHSMMVTNRGLHTSCNGNSQQNRLTPDWPDTVTREVPSEAIYLYDVDRGEWYSPTHHPLNDPQAKNEAEFGVDGTSVFRMSKGDLATELTVFVPSQDPTGVYLLTVKNNADYSRRIRVAPYFQMALAFQPERSGPLSPRYDKVLDALFFENCRNMFRTGPAFVSMSIPADGVETKRGKFFGSGRGVTHPYMVEKGESDASQLTDSAQIAAFLGDLEIPAHSEHTVAIVLGQTDNRKRAVQLVQKYKNLDMVRKELDETRRWWLGLMGTAEVRTDQPEFDRYLNWLKYQAVAERVWARRGFYQTSGAFGFRDQLQDTVNLMWVDPALARKQIILHASQQFIEGDVYHWFFTLTDGRSAFSCRSHASDNLLWIAWGVGEYVRMTGDETILDEMTTYAASEFPFAPLPKNKQGWGALYSRSTRADTVYKHCMRSIDTVLNKRMGRNGLPLMGVGDWNDGLDEIGSEGKGESVWLGFFLYYILKEMLPVIEKKDGASRKEHYVKKMKDLAASLEKTWRNDRYLRAIHDNGTEVGIKGSGVWEIDALTAAWSVMTGINFDRSVTIFNTALSVLEKGSVILLGWPALREDTKPYLGRSSKYPEGVRENGMYCHGVQWLVRASRLLAEEFERRGDRAKADEYRATAYRLWLKISPLAHVTPQEIEIYGGQPNKQPADFLTTFEPGRMIWNGYTGAAGWMLRQAFEGVVGATLIRNEMLLPDDLDRPRGNLKLNSVFRDIAKSPYKGGIPAASKNKVGVLPPELKPAY